MLLCNNSIGNACYAGYPRACMGDGGSIWWAPVLMTIVFQSRLTGSPLLSSRSLRVLLVSGRSLRHQRNRHIVIPIEPYYEHEKHFEHVLCFLSQVHETFYTSIETTCIDRETILYRNLRWLTPWPFKHSEGHLLERQNHLRLTMKFKEVRFKWQYKPTFIRKAVGF